MPTAIRRTAAPVAPPPVPTPADDQLVHNLFTFSPFGFACHQCEKKPTIQLDERCISRHLKKHGMDSKVSTVRLVMEEYEKRIRVVKASGTIQPYRLDNKTYEGFSCVCGQNIHARKDSAFRHCKRTGCDPKRLREVDLIKLRCGRFVTQAQVDNLFINNDPRIFQQFDYPLARAILLPFLPPKEKQDHTYTHMYYPLISNAGGKA